MDRTFAHSVAEELRLNAYRKVQPDYATAKETLLGKKLVFGEQSCVPFYYPDSEAENRQVMLLVGYGGLDGKTYFFSNLIDPTSDLSEATVYVNDASAFMGMTDAFSYMSEKMDMMMDEIRNQLAATPYAVGMDGETSDIGYEYRNGIGNDTVLMSKQFNDNVVR